MAMLLLLSSSTSWTELISMLSTLSYLNKALKANLTLTDPLKDNDKILAPLSITRAEGAARAGSRICL